MRSILSRHLRAGAILLAFLTLTVGTSFISMGHWNLVVNLIIAAAKAGIVLVWFMCLGRSGASTRFAAAAGIVWLLLLFGLAMTDFAWR
jgi:cytochrome c oxidase subunit IV